MRRVRRGECGEDFSRRPCLMHNLENRGFVSNRRRAGEEGRETRAQERFVWILTHPWNTSGTIQMGHCIAFRPRMRIALPCMLAQERFSRR